jgi:hypothetical protein
VLSPFCCPRVLRGRNTPGDARSRRISICEVFRTVFGPARPALALAGPCLLALAVFQGQGFGDDGFKPPKDFHPPSDFRSSKDFQPSKDFGPSREFKPLRDFNPAHDFKPPRDFTPSKDFQPSREFRPSRDFKPSNDFKPGAGFKPSRPPFSQQANPAVSDPRAPVPAASTPARRKQISITGADKTTEYPVGSR